MRAPPTRSVRTRPRSSQTPEERLIRAGVLRPASAKRKALGVPRLKRGAGAAALAALLAERDSGR